MSDMSLKQDNSISSHGVVRGFITLVLGGMVLIALVIAYIWFSGGDGHSSMPTIAPELSLQPGDTRILLQIVPEESEVRFSINETLLGEPKTVVGTTNQVAGDLLVDFETPANSQIGLLRINMRTLTTDNEFRNRALRGQILQADQTEFAEFRPTALLQLPATVTPGVSFDFQIKGYLSVRGVTREVTFEATLTPINEDRLEGNAHTIVRYQDFGISIPEAPGVANVADEVQLEISFVAQTIAE